jgi:hypothetical protein
MILAACGADYVGDGELRDRGRAAAADRYVLDLGTIRLGEGAREYSFRGLPSEEFTLGFEFVSLGPEGASSLCNELGISGELSLIRASGEVVFEQREPLHEWVWTCGVGGCDSAFAYLRGERVEEPTAPGESRIRLVRGPVDNAWGTYFRPAKSESYALGAELRSDSELPVTLEVRLIGRGGGWK